MACGSKPKSRSRMRRQNGFDAVGSRRLRYRRLRAALEVLSEFLDLEETAKQRVHRPLLDLCPGLPSREGRFGDAKKFRELLLGQPKRVSTLLDLSRREQTNRLAKCVAQSPISFVLNQQRSTFPAFQDGEVFQFDRIRPPIMIHVDDIRVQRRRINRTFATLAAFPRKRFHGFSLPAITHLDDAR